MPVNALLGATNAILRIVADQGPRAVVICSGAEAARYRVERFAGLPRRPPAGARGARVADARARRSCSRRSAGRSPRRPSWRPTTCCTRSRWRRSRRAVAALLMTGDRDMFQCASPDVTVLYLKTGVRGFELMGPAEVRARYGVPPALVPDFIALRGDPSDGLPGARGIGEKGAADLLRRHGSLEAALARPTARRRASRARCASRPTSCATSSTSRRCSASTSPAPPTASPTSPAAPTRPRRSGCADSPSACARPATRRGSDAVSSQAACRAGTGRHPYGPRVAVEDAYELAYREAVRALPGWHHGPI